MTAPGGDGLAGLLRLYEEHALARLGAVATLEAVQLIEAVDRELPDGVLAATREELEAAMALAAARAHGSETAALLGVEMACFLDLALDRGLTRRHPLRTAAAADEGAAVPTRRELAGLLARLVGKAVEEGVSGGLLMADLAVSMAELGERDELPDRLVGTVSGRWRLLAHRYRRPLDAVRVVLPVVTLLLALSSFFSCDGPLGSRTLAAMATGAGVRQLQILTYNMPPDIGDPETITTLDELGRRTGLATDLARETFALRRVRHGVVYLEHLESETLVVISGEWVGSLGGGTWRMER